MDLNRDVQMGGTTSTLFPYFLSTLCYIYPWIEGQRLYLNTILGRFLSLWGYYTFLILDHFLALFEKKVFLPLKKLKTLRW